MLGPHVHVDCCAPNNGVDTPRKQIAAGMFTSFSGLRDGYAPIHRGHRGLAVTQLKGRAVFQQELACHTLSMTSETNQKCRTGAAGGVAKNAKIAQRSGQRLIRALVLEGALLPAIVPSLTLRDCKPARWACCNGSRQLEQPPWSGRCSCRCRAPTASHAPPFFLLSLSSPASLLRPSPPQALHAASSNNPLFAGPAAIITFPTTTSSILPPPRSPLLRQPSDSQTCSLVTFAPTAIVGAEAALR